MAKRVSGLRVTTTGRTQERSACSHFLFHFLELRSHERYVLPVVWVQIIPEKPIIKAKLIGETTTPIIPNISISQEGIQYYTGEQKGADVPPILVCHVQWRNGLKYVTFRSTYVVKNLTPYDAEMQIIKVTDGKVQVMHGSNIG